MKLIGTFVQNLDYIIERILGDSIESIFSDHVVFAGKLDANYAFLNSLFIEIYSFQRNLFEIDQQVDWLLNSPKASLKLKNLAKKYKGGEIRLRFLLDKQTISYNKRKIDKIEKRLESIGFNIDKLLPDHELWFNQYNNTGTGWIGFRISSNPDFHTKERKGVLRPQIAYMMNLLSLPKPGDTCLDPFAGSGEIIRIRTQYFPKGECVSFEKKSNESLQSIKSPIHTVVISDFLEDDDYHNYFDSIVTDPPWGNYEKEISITDLYKKAFIKFDDMLKRKGKVILLTARENESFVLSNIYKHFKLDASYDFKVWGRPSTLFDISKL